MVVPRSLLSSVAGAAAGLLVLAGCTGADSSSDSTHLRYGYDLENSFTNTFDPAQSNGDCDGLVTGYIYDTLVRRDQETGEPIPGIAESWEVTGDEERSITFHLRDDVEFSNGEKLDADAVKQSIDHNNENDQLSTLNHIDNVEVVDPLTVRVNLNDDQSTPFLYAIGEGRDTQILAPSSLETADKKPVGSGPFMLESFTPGEGIVLTKNPKYWDEDSFKFDGIDFVQAAVGPPAVVRFQADDIDLVRFEAESLPTMRKDRDAEVVIKPTQAYLQIQFRQGYNDGRTSPFADEQVRKAVRYAIDTEKINELVQLGEGEVATQSLPKSSPGYDPTLADAYAYDPAEAKRLLTEAGYPDGFEFTLVIPGPGIENMQRQGELVQSMLADVGITAKITPISGNDIATNYYINGGGDAFAAARLASSFYPGAYFDAYAPFQFVAIWNQSEREDIGNLTRQAQAATDEAETAELTHQAAKIVSDEALEVPIAFMPQFLATNKNRVGGVVGGQRDICDRPDLSQVTVITDGGQ